VPIRGLFLRMRTIISLAVDELTEISYNGLTSLNSPVDILGLIARGNCNRSSRCLFPALWS